MPTQLKSLEQQVAILKKVVRDKLGTGIWGLDKRENFTHEEIVFWRAGLAMETLGRFSTDLLMSSRGLMSACFGSIISTVVFKD